MSNRTHDGKYISVEDARRVQRFVGREVQPACLVAWIAEHPIASKQRVALGVFLLLVLPSFAG